MARAMAFTVAPSKPRVFLFRFASLIAATRSNPPRWYFFELSIVLMREVLVFIDSQVRCVESTFLKN